MLQLVGALAFGYLVGSIPTGVLVGRLYRGIDIRERGSGSSGGTNVARVLGWGPGILVVALDVFKGFLGARVGGWIGGTGGPLEAGDVVALAGLFTVLGHVLPLFARFHGGKGVAPAAGVLLAVSPMAFWIAAGAFVVSLAACRVVSVASIGSSIALFIVLAILRWAAGKGIPDGLLLLSLALSGVIIVAHRSNLARLVAGKEPTVGRSLPDRDGSSSP